MKRFFAPALAGVLLCLGFAPAGTPRRTFRSMNTMRS